MLDSTKYKNQTFESKQYEQSTVVKLKCKSKQCAAGWFYKHKRVTECWYSVRDIVAKFGARNLRDELFYFVWRSITNIKLYCSKTCHPADRFVANACPITSVAMKNTRSSLSSTSSCKEAEHSQLNAFSHSVKSRSTIPFRDAAKHNVGLFLTNLLSKRSWKKRKCIKEKITLFSFFFYNSLHLFRSRCLNNPCAEILFN